MSRFFTRSEWDERRRLGSSEVHGSWRRFLLVASVVLGAGAGCTSTESKERTDLPAFDGESMQLGALLCISGANSARAITAERAALLAEEFINGSTREFPDTAPEQIPCRASGTCGVWSGRSEDGRSLRGRLELTLADAEQREDRAIAAATQLVTERGVPLLIGPCTANEMHGVFEQVTRTQTVLVSPFVTADSITLLEDRTEADLAAGRDGYVFRTIPPDYIQAEALAQLATNRDSPRVLVRHDDAPTEDCTSAPASFCSARYEQQGPYECQASRRTAQQEKIYVQHTTTSCSPESPTSCTLLGQNFDCVAAPDGGGNVCARYTERKSCVKVVQPEVGMILHADNSVGQKLRDELQTAWVSKRGKHILSVESFDPRRPAEFFGVVKDLFEGAANRMAELKKQGALPSHYPPGDAVVFLLAEPTEAALLLQEWLIQKSTLGEGAGDVFWLGTDALKSRALLDGVAPEALRNVYVIDPFVLDSNNRTFFDELYRQRWQDTPGDYAANVFDTVLLAALANERAGWLRETAGPGALPRNTAQELKDSLRAVSAGCAKPFLGASCTNEVSTFSPNRFADAIQAVRSGQEVRLQGVTGDLSLSPEGDRLNDLNVWRIAIDDGEKRFVLVQTFEPQSRGINLRE